jgi:hypothetical protein
MKVRASISAVAAAAALLGTGAFTLPAAASVCTASHTLKFIDVVKASTIFSKTTSAGQDTVVSSTGKVLGYADIYLTATSPTTAAGSVALDVNGGFLYGTLTLNLATGAITDGKVTGGTGAFEGATGTIAATTLSSTRTAVTVTYTT